MDNVGAILDEKGREVITIRQQATVTEAVQLMSRRRVGAVLVCEGEHCVGIFTERDVMNRVVLAGRDPATTLVAEVMTTEVACVEPDASPAQAMAIMTERRCRHLPVVEHGKIAGIISIGDVVRWESRNQQFEIRMLRDYIQGKYPA